MIFPSLNRTLTGLLLVAVIGLATMLTGCDVLEVENPNSVLEEDLRDPSSTQALRNGAVATTARAYGYMYALNAEASDELSWIGSFDAWNQIDRGNIGDPLNQFLQDAFPFVGEARYTADLAIRRLESFQDEGTLQSPNDLLGSYEQGALMYMLIGDMFEDFALSTPDEPAPPVGESNMDTMYTTAIGYLDKAISIARNQSNAQAETRLLAIRARAKHGLGVWDKLQSGSTPSDPLVGSQGVIDDATAYLDRVNDDTDEQYQFEYGQTSISNYVAGQVNDRQELNIAPSYVDSPDPITDDPDPRTQALIEEFRAGPFVPLSYTSTREMRLLLAEAHLANNNTDDAVTQINLVRTLGGLPAYDPDAHEPTPQEMLEYERKANLFMMGRRLNDLYRFGESSPEWGSSSVAVTTPGTVFPIANNEIDSNPHID
jgi:hypothetical protein